MGLLSSHHSPTPLNSPAAYASFNFTTYTIKTLQLIALSLKGAQNPLPPFFSSFIRSIGVVLLNLPEVHFDCLGRAGAYAGDNGVFILHGILAVTYALLSMRYIGSARCARCGIAEGVTLAQRGGEVQSKVQQLWRFAATKAHPSMMLGSSLLISMLEPIVVTRAHRVLHCIKTSVGYRLKENADLVCYNTEHNNAVRMASVSLTVAAATFLWTVGQTWWLFARRQPQIAGEEATGVEVSEADRMDNAEREAAGRCGDAMFQLGLDRNSMLHHWCCCHRDRFTLPIRSHNAELNVERSNELDGKIVSFGNVIDAESRPHLFWFQSLQSLVSCCLVLIAGVFGGTHAAGLKRSKFAQILTSASSIVLLMSYGAIARSVKPFRNRARDSWKLHALLFTVCVAAFSKLLALALALRTAATSAAYDEFVIYLALALVVVCVALCATIIISYLRALGVHLLAFALFKKSGCTAVVMALVAKLQRPPPSRNDGQGAGNNAIELAHMEGGDVLREQRAVEQLNPFIQEVGNIDLLFGDDDPFAAGNAAGRIAMASNPLADGSSGQADARGAVPGGSLATTVNPFAGGSSDQAATRGEAVDCLATTVNPFAGGSSGGQAVGSFAMTLQAERANKESVRIEAAIAVSLPAGSTSELDTSTDVRSHTNTNSDEAQNELPRADRAVVARDPEVEEVARILEQEDVLEVAAHIAATDKARRRAVEKAQHKLVLDEEEHIAASDKARRAVEKAQRKLVLGEEFEHAAMCADKARRVVERAQRKLVADEEAEELRRKVLP